MSKYTETLNVVESLFGSETWTNTGITAYPSNYPKDSGVNTEFAVIEVIPGNEFTNYGSTGLKGQIIVQIYIPSDKGVKRSYEIADILDSILERKELEDGNGRKVLITGTSTMSHQGIDQDDQYLFRTDYAVSFTKY